MKKWKCNVEGQFREQGVAAIRKAGLKFLKKKIAKKKEKKKRTRQVSRKSIAEIFRKRSCNNRVKVPRKKPFNDTRATFKKEKKKVQQ